MRKHFLFAALLGLALFSGCRKDFEVNEPWKETDIIYGLLDIRDSVIPFGDSFGTPLSIKSLNQPQYIRISKAFLNGGQDANTIAKTTPDSIYHQDSLEVQIKDGINTYTLYKVTDKQKEPGTFNNSKNVLYRTPAGFKLNPKATYELSVRNTVTGIKATAKTTAIDLPDVTDIANLKNGLEFNIGKPKSFVWRAADKVKIYDLDLVMYYKEWTRNQTDTVIKTATWPLQHSIASEGAGNSMNYFVSDGSAFYNFLAQTIPVDNNKVRKMIGSQTIIQGAGEDLYYYIEANKPSLSITSKKPEFTNIKGGDKNHPAYGIFSARSTTTIFYKFTAQTINHIVTTAPTKKLNFIE